MIASQCSESVIRLQYGLHCAVSDVGRLNCYSALFGGHADGHNGASLFSHAVSELFNAAPAPPEPSAMASMSNTTPSAPSAAEGVSAGHTTSQSPFAP